MLCYFERGGKQRTLTAVGKVVPYNVAECKISTTNHRNVEYLITGREKRSLRAKYQLSDSELQPIVH